MSLCTSRGTSREFTGTWDTHQYNIVRKLFRDATVSGEATQVLKHFLCDACSRLKQPPARRQVAIAHAEMFNAVVDVNFWKLKERRSREKKTLTVLSIVEAQSGMLMASRVPIRHRTRCGRLPRTDGFVGLVQTIVARRREEVRDDC